MTDTGEQAAREAAAKADYAEALARIERLRRIALAAIKWRALDLEPGRMLDAEKDIERRVHLDRSGALRGARRKADEALRALAMVIDAEAGR